ncbi:hypothetical protein CAEBREN_04771 [Caenorhabditis brenneri]|uniref:Uncharacterized protein n=1 Tax=Caenorhabditis brenneri TaxID=135651 RepID=G0MC59_CAEBE|nr:hypothetical protein CAEBREN_04771 [Caenorhabditis brenneri]
MKLQFTLPILIILLAIVGHSVAQNDDDDIKTELGKQLREQLDQLLEKMKDAIGRYQIKEIRQKLKDMRQDAIEKIKERIQEQKDKFNGTVEANP